MTNKNNKIEAIATESKKAVTVKKTVTKKNEMLTIEQIVKMYHAAGIGVYSSTCSSKSYRIMRGGSSLNIKRGSYVIYTTDDDYKNLESVTKQWKCKDLEMTEGGNTSDKKRRNVVVCKTKETLEKLLSVYAINPVNQIQ